VLQGPILHALHKYFPLRGVYGQIGLGVALFKFIKMIPEIS